MQASIIVLSMNQQPFSRACLESVRRYSAEVDYEIVWVDNGSHDGTVEWLKSTDIEQIILNERNQGFAGGCNQGLSAARGDFKVLLNNDIVVTEGWLSGLIEVGEHRREVGLVGPCTNYISGIQQIDEARTRYGDDRGELLQAYAREFRRQRRGQWLRNNRLVGFCLGITRACFEAVGLLDERYLTGCFEDDDYCVQAMEAGFELWVAGDVFVHHHGHATIDAPENRLDKRAASLANAKRFEDKWGPAIIEKYQLKLYKPKDGAPG